MASDYSREEVEKEMEVARGLDREELIRRPKQLWESTNRNRGQKKYAMVTRWDPRGPNIKEGLKQLERIAP